jgi:hypothetical protein
LKARACTDLQKSTSLADRVLDQDIQHMVDLEGAQAMQVGMLFHRIFAILREKALSAEREPVGAV